MTTISQNQIHSDLKNLPLSPDLSSSPEGLTQAEAQERLAHYGYNELPETKTNPYLKFLSYFWGPIPWMIEVAAILSALVRHWADFGIILALLVVNAIVGFWEEYQAGNTIAALKKQMALQARVKRDGAWKSLPARELVPGDLIRIRIGDIIPADVQITITRDYGHTAAEKSNELLFHMAIAIFGVSALIAWMLGLRWPSSPSGPGCS
ncbi:MAG: cation-transporting P-type ATPase, partial [Anaerolineales bacterium]